MAAQHVSLGVIWLLACSFPSSHQLPSFSSSKHRARLCIALGQRHPFLCRPPMSWMLEVVKDSGGQFGFEGFSFSSKVSISSCLFLLPHQLFFPTASLWPMEISSPTPWQAMGLSTSSHNTGTGRSIVALRKNQPYPHLDFRLPDSGIMRQ